MTTTTDTPAYIRIAAALRERISNGDLPPRSALPPERELCLEYGVSRMTARKAFGVLESEGLVYKNATRGTFVAEPRVELRLGSFSQEVTRSGHQPGAELLWAEEQLAAPVVAHALGLDAGAPVHALRRLRRSDGEPLALETTYYPAELTPGLLSGNLAGSLWDELKDRYDITPGRTVANLEVVVLDEVASRRLATRPAAAGMQLIRRTYDTSGRCFEYASDLYRADRISLVIERSVNE
ncbi:GntR family transcriptional regulator [Arthrobacter burdickii]|uniref:GntR family transcriptional regulator n=1 Tax=Arthrobacter burdickii TaxID=3035920 RepID=A0ABT8JWG6_9MICC|nr:GntR family transcriptional regulator [Arthrobacter burdickii]MDN4609516.1 GntR family transcriptional regulator [Arthrobacter burdickii]